MPVVHGRNLLFVWSIAIGMPKKFRTAGINPPSCKRLF
jgi:hypothetical protein